MWLLLTLGPLLFLQQRLHYEIQAVLYLVTRRTDVTGVLFALLFFPGVLLHEISHWLVAGMLRVRTGRISLIPRPLPGNRLQLGFVEAEASDPLRETLIGAAPLISGSTFVAYVGLARWKVPMLIHLGASTDWQASWQGLITLFQAHDFWLWFYLVITISSMMFPSASDRRAWLPILLGVGLVLLASVLLGAGPWMKENLAQPFESVLTGFNQVMGISAAAHLIILLPIWGIRVLLERALKVKVGFA